MELQGRIEELKRQGLGVAAISYDSVDTLKAFSASRGITFPLISDAGSEIIKRYGLLNTTVQPGTRTYGIPFPGTFMVDARGVVQEVKSPFAGIVLYVLGTPPISKGEPVAFVGQIQR